MSRTLSLFATLLVCALAHADDPAKYAAFGGCERVFVGGMAAVKSGPVAASDPPISTFTYEFEKAEPLRGGKPEARAVYSFSVRGQGSPYEVGKAYIVGAQKRDGGWQVAAILPDTADARKAVAKAVSLPVGWAWDGDTAVSPWASLGAKAWPADGPKLADVTCGKCGRPAATVPAGVTVSVERVPAKNPEKFKNDQYGDGAFKITVTNTTKKDVTVPAVLTAGGEVLWADSVVFLDGGKPLLLPTAGKVTKNAKALELKAGESTSGEVNSLLLGGVEWPKGGQRVHLDVAIGDSVQHTFFYYFSAVHDSLRMAAIAELTK